MDQRKVNLAKQFKAVGLKLKILDKPIGRTSSNEIFQMDVGRKVTGTRRTEWFEIYPGGDGVNIQIIDVDDKLNQILLLVQEPEREFEVEERKQHSRYANNPDNKRKQLISENVKFRETQTHFIIIEKTSAEKRHFLMGVDERQLFVAQLKTGVTNINEARNQLGSTIRFHEGLRKMTPKRQGEWFFVKATRAQEEFIQFLIEKNEIWIETKQNIGARAGKPRGNPHTADELVVVPVNPEKMEWLGRSKHYRKNNPFDLKKFPIRSTQVYVRGSIRHTDHKTIKYSHWYQVILNNEGNTANATQSWID